MKKNSSRNKTNKILILISLIALTLFLIGSAEGDNLKNIFKPYKNIATKQFQSIEEFSDFVKKNENLPRHHLPRIGIVGTVSEESAEMIPTTAGQRTVMSFGKELDYSRTNNQIASVDEADIIKTDGDYIYTISENQLFIIKAYPGEDAEIESIINFENTPLNLFVKDNYLVVFGNYNSGNLPEKIDYNFNQGMTYFEIYNIKQRKNPELVKEYNFEGQYFQARMFDDYVYFITTTWPEHRTELPTPVIIEDNLVKAMPVSDIYYYDIPYRSPVFANIHSIKINSPEKEINSKTVAVEGDLNMYMSEENIYITYSEYSDAEVAEDEIRAAEEEVFSKLIYKLIVKHPEIFIQVIKSDTGEIPESMEDEMMELEREAQELISEKLKIYGYPEYTVINKIQVKKGDIRFVANGVVPGRILNQFSLDEYNSVLRIATTVEDWNGNEDNNVFTLDRNLKIMDNLKGLAQGEEIYSTRFIEGRLYMVTFRQVDPFFVIDLSNPRNIRELGELKIPGFSRYLHPYDDHTIIGIGRDATAQGRTQGLKISLFDVRNVNKPKEVAKFVSKEQHAQSIAEYEHKAFLFSKEKELLVIPAYSHGYDEGDQSYNGAMVFKITKNGIELRGIVDHSVNDERYSRPKVERSLYIEELLYTKSSNLLRINKIEDLSKVKNLELTSEGSSDPYPIY